MVQENNIQNLGSRREFLKKAVTGAGVAFAAPAILSMVRPTDLAAQVSGGVSVDQGPPPHAGGPTPRGRGRR